MRTSGRGYRSRPLAASGFEPVAVLWDVATGDLRWVLSEGDGPVTSVDPVTEAPTPDIPDAAPGTIGPTRVAVAYAEAMRAHLERSRRQLRIIVFGAEGSLTDWPMLPKRQVAERLWDLIGDRFRHSRESQAPGRRRRRS